MKRYEGQVAVITGGAQGIGLGIAQRLGSEGAAVALLDKNGALAEQAAATLTGEGVQALALAADVTRQADVEQAVAAVRERFGRIDVLVTAAGITGQTNLQTHQVDPADFDRVMELNVKAMFLCIRAVLPTMLTADYGRIVNIASISGKDGNAGMLAYSTSKAAVIGLTKVIGKEYAETGITCNCIAPAVVRTAMVDALPPEQVKYMTDKIPMKRTGEIDEIAAVAAFAASRECSFTTGFCFDASGGRTVY
ncbi:MAG TPA: SDR family NAD(P)-dependent oxidoreductase [bacterium]|nr:SDR family NAD(P)-dependent oxidoreductase [bacterium]